MWWIGILIGVGFGLLIWFLIWYYKKHPEAKTEQWLEIANGISDIVGVVLRSVDKDPKTESVTERIYRYASLAVEDEAWRFIESLAEADNIPLTGAERGIISGIIEAALYFLPKPAEVVIIEPEEPDTNDTESGGDKEPASDSPGT